MAAGPTEMTSSRPHRRAAAVLAAVVLVATAAAPAKAADTASGFALTPAGSGAALRLHGAPGGIVRGAVRVRNLSARPITVILQGADIENAGNGNADYVATRPVRTGRWIELSSTRVLLKPHASRRVGFDVRVPADAAGGAHYGGVVAVDAANVSAAARASKKRTFSFKRIDRQAVPLTLRLPGPVTRSLSLRTTTLTVAPAGAALVLNLVPGGNELIASAKVDLRVLRGDRVVFSRVATLGQLFPGSALDYRIPWQGRPSEGDYRVEGTITPAGAEPITLAEHVSFTPAKATELKRETPAAPGSPAPGLPLWLWLALGAGAALLLGLTLAVIKLARRPAGAMPA